MTESGQPPSPQALQFEYAEPIAATPSAGTGPLCVACKQRTGNTYFHAQGHVVCPMCADRIQSGQQAPPPLSLARAFLYGAGAALGGSILYAAVSIITGFEIGLIAIVVGVMVGKAIRHASGGLGGRPQQILAVVLTYFAITTSYIPLFVYHMAKDSHTTVQRTQSPDGSTAPVPASSPRRPARVSLVGALLSLLLLATIAPFLSLGSGVSGLITLFIIFIGLQRAWRLTGRSEILVMGPYEAVPAQ